MLLPTPIKPTLKIGIIRSSSIGDVVLASACLDLLKKLDFPTQLIWIGRKPSLEIIAASYPEITCLEMSKGQGLGQLKTIADQLADRHILIDLQTNLRSAMLTNLVTRFSNVKVFSAAKSRFHRNRLVFEAFLRGRKGQVSSRARHPKRLQYQMMLEPLIRGLRDILPVEMLDGLAAISPHPSLPVLEQSQERPWFKELRVGVWLAIAPGASYDAKKAPESLYIDILNTIRDHIESGDAAPVSLLFLGDDSDRIVARTILDELGWAYPTLNLAGRLALWENALALQKAKNLLCNDSALAHIAEAVGTPTTVLFGPTVEGFGFAPWSPTSQTFSSDIGCRPCSRHGKTPCRFGDKLCFTKLDCENIGQHLIRNIGIAKDLSSKPELAPTSTLLRRSTPSLAILFQ